MRPCSIDIESVRMITEDRCGPDDPLDFYRVAIELGATTAEATRINTTLTARVMRSRGAI